MMRPRPEPSEILLPETLFVIPSKYNPWRGRRRPDARFTIEQLAEMKRRDIDPETVEFVTVRQSATPKEYWVPIGSPYPIYLMPCPILRRVSPDRLEVIAPMGSAELVANDGKIVPRRGKH